VLFQGRKSPTLQKRLKGFLENKKKPIKNTTPMKGVFWNSRGLTDLAKHRYLAEMVREEQINFRSK